MIIKLRIRYLNSPRLFLAFCGQIRYQQIFLSHLWQSFLCLHLKVKGSVAKHLHDHHLHQPSIIVTITNTITIIMVTRPKPAYGRQGLAGSWGQDTDEVSTSGAQFRFNQPGTINDNPPGNLENHRNEPKTMKNHETTLKNHGNQAKTMKPP